MLYTVHVYLINILNVYSRGLSLQIDWDLEGFNQLHWKLEVSRVFSGKQIE